MGNGHSSSSSSPKMLVVVVVSQSTASDPGGPGPGREFLDRESGPTSMGSEHES